MTEFLFLVEVSPLMQMVGTSTTAGEDGEVYLVRKRLHGAGQH